MSLHERCARVCGSTKWMNRGRKERREIAAKKKAIVQLVCVCVCLPVFNSRPTGAVVLSVVQYCGTVSTRQFAKLINKMRLSIET